MVWNIFVLENEILCPKTSLGIKEFGPEISLGNKEQADQTAQVQGINCLA